MRNLEPTGPYWTGWGFFGGGGVVMALMMWARQRFPWWPVHPIGFPAILGLVAGQVVCVGIWLVIDYFTGEMGNRVFKI